MAVTQNSQLWERVSAALEKGLRGDLTHTWGQIVDQIVAAVGEVTAKQVLVVTCTTHGEIAREEVLCPHDTQEVMRQVSHAHGASYGGNCKGATLKVELIEP